MRRRQRGECVRVHLELLTLSAKCVAFAARREPQRTTKNILELTITGKIETIPIIPNALIAANCYGMCPIPTCKTQIFGGSDRERVGYVGHGKTIVREVKKQLDNLNEAFPAMAKAWEQKLPAINIYAISVAPRGEDRTRENENRLVWESFIVLQDNQAKDEQQQRAFTSNLLYSKDDTKKFINICDENFGEEGTPAWWRISRKARAAPEPKAMPRHSAGSGQPCVPPSTSSSAHTTGRAP